MALRFGGPAVGDNGRAALHQSIDPSRPRWASSSSLNMRQPCPRRRHRIDRAPRLTDARSRFDIVCNRRRIFNVSHQLRLTEGSVHCSETIANWFHSVRTRKHIRAAPSSTTARIRRDENAYANRGQLAEEAAGWAFQMSQEGAEASRADFEAWLVRGALHRPAYDRAAENYTADIAVPANSAPGQDYGRVAQKRDARMLVGAALMASGIAFIVWLTKRQARV